MAKTKKTGGSMGGRIEKTFSRRRRDRKRFQREEEYWASLSGPVRVSRIKTEDLSAKEDTPPAE